MDKIIKKVASGLRNMSKLPDGFIFLENEEFVWDNNEILGLKVVFINLPKTGYEDLYPNDINFIPFWNEETICYNYIKEFLDGYFKWEVK